MNILCWLAAGALIKIFCSEKVVGALIGVGVLKGMNTVSSVAVKPSLCRTRSETPETGFLALRLK